MTHDAAGLAEILVLRLLPGARDDHGVHLAVIEKLAEHTPGQNGERRRRAEPGACGKRALHTRVKAAHVQPQLLECGDNAADERFGRAEFTCAQSEMTDIDLKGLEALRLHADEVRAVRLTVRIVPELNGRGEHPAVLVVCMVAGQLSPAGNKDLFIHMHCPLNNIVPLIGKNAHSAANPQLCGAQRNLHSQSSTSIRINQNGVKVNLERRKNNVLTH